MGFVQILCRLRINLSGPFICHYVMHLSLVAKSWLKIWKECLASVQDCIIYPFLKTLICPNISHDLGDLLEFLYNVYLFRFFQWYWCCPYHPSICRQSMAASKKWWSKICKVNLAICLIRFYLLNSNSSHFSRKNDFILVVYCKRTRENVQILIVETRKEKLVRNFLDIQCKITKRVDLFFNSLNL